MVQSVKVVKATRNTIRKYKEETMVLHKQFVVSFFVVERGIEKVFKKDEKGGEKALT